ncbi:MAG TPA: hypothetical protein VEY51_09515 [Chondromyces sp.]|nr:hypothetical protein [Chondromyces sp.]
MEKAAEQLICSQCQTEIADEQEYEDNGGVCDDCYSIPLRKRRGLVLNN